MESQALLPFQEAYLTLAIRLQPWVTLLNSQLLYSSPSQIHALFFFPGPFLLKISRTGGSQNQPQKKKKNGILVDAEIGISVSWVVQGRNKTWMQMSFIHRP